VLAEVDGAGLQLLVALAHKPALRAASHCSSAPSTALQKACATLGLQDLLKPVPDRSQRMSTLSNEDQSFILPRPCPPF
jgi:hypothetical protein